MLEQLDLVVRRGTTVDLPIRVESDTLRYAPISAVAQSAPIRITATAHGCPDGWRAAVMNAKGMTEINATHNPPKRTELRRATVIDADTVEFNTVNAAGFRAYTSGGQVVFYKPLELSMFDAARMDVKSKVGGDTLFSFSTTDGTLELDSATQTLWLRLTDEQSAVLPFSVGVFDIELVTPGGAVTAVCSAESTITVLPEITTST